MQYYNVGGLNLYTNPLSSTDGQLIFSTNNLSFPYGAKTKRSGYSAFLGTPDNAQVQSLFQFQNVGNNSSEMYLYRASGSKVYSSYQGTGAWTPTVNGTISNTAHFGQAILDNVMIGGDGVGSTRWTTNGTTWVNGTLAPVGEFFTQYQNRIHVGGTSQTLFYSTTNDATNWNTSGTSDSSSFEIPGPGKMGAIFKSADRLIATKSTGQIFRWDGYSLVDMSTLYGPSSPYSIGKAEDYRFFMNQYGAFGYGGEKPQLLSNAIQRQIYNQQNTGIQGTVFPTIPGESHYYDYLASVGSITDDFTQRTINNAIIKYDYQKNEFLNWNTAHRPTSFLSYRDKDNNQQLIFGDANGQVYKFDNTMSDAGLGIESEMVFVYHFGAPEYDKKWNWLRMMFNPGCEANVQVATANTYTYDFLVWKDIPAPLSDGVLEYRFPPESRSRLLFVRIYESSKNSRYSYYGTQIDGVVQPIT